MKYVCRFHSDLLVASGVALLLSVCVCCFGAVTGISLSCCLSWERADSCALLSSESRVWEFTRWQRQMTAERMQPAGRTPPYLTPPRLDHPFRKPSAITLFSCSLSLSLYYSHNFKLLYWHCGFAYIYCPIKYRNTELEEMGGTSYANKHSKYKLQYKIHYTIQYTWISLFYDYYPFLCHNFHYIENYIIYNILYYIRN